MKFLSQKCLFKCHAWLFVFVVITSLTILGCREHAVLPDNSTLIVEPGVGITNVMCIGMSLNEIRNSTPGVKVLEDRVPGDSKSVGEFVLVPWLGAETYFDKKQTGVTSIHFHVQPIELVNRRVDVPFQGRIRNGVSFAGESPTRDQIIAAFGSVKAATSELLAEDKYQPYSRSNGNGYEELCYPTSGIAFHLRNDRVLRFVVFSPIQPMGR